MSEAAMNVVKWLHSSSGRSKRSETVDQGCYVLEHVATGRFFLGQSETVSRDVDKQLSQLPLGKHSSKLLNGLYSKDSDIRIYEYPIKAKRERTKLLIALRDDANPTYLCINPRDVKK